MYMFFNSNVLFYHACALCTFRNTNLIMSPLLKILEWLLIAFMIKTKLFTVAYKALGGLVPMIYTALWQTILPFALSYTNVSFHCIPSCHGTLAQALLFPWNFFTFSSSSSLALLTRSNPPLMSTDSTIFLSLLLVMIEVLYVLCD